MFREITLGQYYPVDSAVHRLDPRTKLFGTMVFIASLFVANNIWGYVIANRFPYLCIFGACRNLPGIHYNVIQ